MSAGVLPWLQSPKLRLDSADYQGKAIDYDVVIVGAGIAGAAAAFKLAEAGMSVAVLEKEALPAQAGSGNHQGMLYLKLSPNLTYQNELLTLGFEKTLQLLNLLTRRALLKKGEDWDDCGLIQLSQSEKQQANQHKLAQRYPKELLYYVDQAEASKIAGASLSAGGLFFPRSGWVSPQSFVKALLTHPRITFKGQHYVSEIQAAHLSCEVPLWRVKANVGVGTDLEARTYFAKVVILAMADQVTTLSQCQEIPFTVVRGQTTTVKGDCHLDTVVSGEGYIAPAKMIDGVMQSTFGATFHRHQKAGNPTDSEHLENIAMLASSSPEVVERLHLSEGKKSATFKTLEGRAATRASAMGSIPIVGPVAERREFLTRFSAIRLDAKAVPDAVVPWELGLYLTTAHGSRGMVTASIAADILYGYIRGQMAAEDEGAEYSQELLSALHPNRFYYRALRFNQPSHETGSE